MRYIVGIDFGAEFITSVLVLELRDDGTYAIMRDEPPDSEYDDVVLAFRDFAENHTEE